MESEISPPGQDDQRTETPRAHAGPRQHENGDAQREREKEDRRKRNSMGRQNSTGIEQRHRQKRPFHAAAFWSARVLWRFGLGKGWSLGAVWGGGTKSARGLAQAKTSRWVGRVR